MLAQPFPPATGRGGAMVSQASATTVLGTTGQAPAMVATRTDRASRTITPRVAARLLAAIIRCGRDAALHR